MKPIIFITLEDGTELTLDKNQFVNPTNAPQKDPECPLEAYTQPQQCMCKRRQNDKGIHITKSSFTYGDEIHKFECTQEDSRDSPLQKIKKMNINRSDKHHYYGDLITTDQTKPRHFSFTEDEFYEAISRKSLWYLKHVMGIVSLEGDIQLTHEGKEYIFNKHGQVKLTSSTSETTGSWEICDAPSFWKKKSLEVSSTVKRTARKVKRAASKVPNQMSNMLQKYSFANRGFVGSATDSGSTSLLERIDVTAAPPPRCAVPYRSETPKIIWNKMDQDTKHMIVSMSDNSQKKRCSNMTHYVLTQPYKDGKCVIYDGDLKELPYYIEVSAVEKGKKIYVCEECELYYDKNPNRFIYNHIMNDIDEEKSIKQVMNDANISEDTTQTIVSLYDSESHTDETKTTNVDVLKTKDILVGDILVWKGYWNKNMKDTITQMSDILDKITSFSMAQIEMLLLLSDIRDDLSHRKEEVAKWFQEKKLKWNSMTDMMKVILDEQLKQDLKKLISQGSSIEPKEQPQKDMYKSILTELQEVSDPINQYSAIFQIIQTIKKTMDDVSIHTVVHVDHEKDFIVLDDLQVYSVMGCKASVMKLSIDERKLTADQKICVHECRKFMLKYVESILGNALKLIRDDIQDYKSSYMKILDKIKQQVKKRSTSTDTNHVLDETNISAYINALQESDIISHLISSTSPIQVWQESLVHVLRNNPSEYVAQWINCLMPFNAHETQPSNFILSLSEQGSYWNMTKHTPNVSCPIFEYDVSSAGTLFVLSNLIQKYLGVTMEDQKQKAIQKIIELMKRTSIEDVISDFQVHL